jgi:effector-binding domain-containing protein
MNNCCFNNRLELILSKINRDMKNLLRVLFVLLFFIVGIVIAGLFLPSKHQIVVKKKIDVPRSIVYSLINDFGRWNDWSPWMKKDKSMQVNIGNISSGKGASMTWKSEVFGNCSANLYHSVPTESVAVDFDFGTKSKTTLLFYIDPTDEGSLLNWTVDLTHLSVWERYFILFNKVEMKLLIESGANSLDSLSRTYSRSRIGEITVEEFKAQQTIMMVDAVKPANQAKRISEMNSEIKNFFEKRDLGIEGKPYLLLLGSVNDSLVKIASAFPIAEKTWVWKSLQNFEMLSTRVVTVSHFGYPTDRAHRAILKYIEENKFERNGVPFEQALYDATINTDTVNWETKVYYPVK